ncbi:uncharacterized protein SPSK_05700 [Sporothrix schenckii 1099-18]|uniref:Uncharacterized protein n=1 Tax=Sporothrix schenckii 1099-18 TaxID=1397361 RepID=A0A0F2LYS9_SPOSC|nr:uncharacterized protein SPSK_05700 [Sporothrix schenckii 1099-18]KJR81046.1 hypothetical protein SPSK_05700 [Sporothrix schenckii 1099-18]
MLGYFVEADCVGFGGCEDEMERAKAKSQREKEQHARWIGKGGTSAFQKAVVCSFCLWLSWGSWPGPTFLFSARQMGPGAQNFLGAIQIESRAKPVSTSAPIVLPCSWGSTTLTCIKH